MKKLISIISAFVLACTIAVGQDCLRGIDYAQYLASIRPGMQTKATDTKALTGEKNYLVILVQFADQSFSVSDPQATFDAMLNTEGYSDNGCIGSAYDYFNENSMGAFKPHFDVVGPVTLSNNLAYYGAEASNGDYDENPEIMAYEACSLAFKAGLFEDLAKYDNDGDGYADNVSIIHAGYSQARSGVSDHIWPHMGVYFSYAVPAKFGNAYMYTYTCSPELWGSSGTKASGIGIFCHELCHVFGLPDFYDVDGTKHGQSSPDGPIEFSIMARGEYNYYSCCPPYLNSMERYMLGWLEDIEVWNEAGSKTLTSIGNNVAARINTNVDGEYYLLEVRKPDRWDAYIKNTDSNGDPSGDAGKGLLIYHVDESARMLDEDMKASWLWRSNKVNIYGEHQCFAITMASRRNNYPDVRYAPFPGAKGVTVFSVDSDPAFLDWDDKNTGFYLNNINYNDGTVTLDLVEYTERTVSGTVKNTSSKGVEGVTMVLDDGKSTYNTTTASDGSYSFTLDSDTGSMLTLTAIKTGYKNASSNFSIERGGIQRDFTLYGISEQEEIELRKYEVPNNRVGFAGTGPMDLMVAVGFTADELKDYVGMKFKQLKFLVGGKTAIATYAFIDFASERQYLQMVPTRYYNGTGYNFYTSIDVEEEDITIPSNTDIYFGYGVTQFEAEAYQSIIVDDSGTSGGGYYYNSVTTNAPEYWNVITNSTGEKYYNAVISATLVESPKSLAEYGFLTIYNPNQGLSYSKGTEFELRFTQELSEMPESVDWYFDGSKQSGSSVKLSASGEHEVRAVLYWSGGKTSELTQFIKVD